MMKNKCEVKVLEATWFYEDVKPMTIQIYKLNYDFYYEIDDGYHDENEKPNLNNFGEQFIAVNNDPEFKNKNEFPFYTCLDLEDAKVYVEKTLNQKLVWETKS
jgi:hypothetical protein